jgi:hypothetical protein
VSKSTTLVNQREHKITFALPLGGTKEKPSDGRVLEFGPAGTKEARIDVSAEDFEIIKGCAPMAAMLGNEIRAI